ncbi:MAG: adenylosuccinate lyase family protein [Desulfobulbaceae bacterium]|nr:adenylosuccinate lyase family protein [Desulfobulbaceae bacterium]
MHSCRNPHSHITDSGFYSQGYTTAEAKAVYCDLRRLQRWLDVEAALATAQANLGIIPAAAGERLAATAHLEMLDHQAIKHGIAITGHSLIPLLDEWQRVAGPQAATYCHYGATTQDIQDTAQSLELKDIFIIIQRDLAQLIGLLADLATEHQSQVIIGRTHGQHALPTTLGLKFAVWLDELLRHAQRLIECRGRLLVSQLFGGVGTMAALGKTPQQLLENYSALLGLIPPATAWHTARDRGAEFVANLALLTGTMAKIANEICQLAKDETGELEEPFHMGKIGSTTMPHKRNPEMCEQVVVLSRLVKACSGICLDGLINEHERDYRAVRLEWVGITDAGLYCCGALNLMINILRGLIVHPERIHQNLESSACLISTEALMFLFGEKIGKPAAHHLLYEAAMAARSSGRSLSEHITAHPLINGKFSAESIKEAANPASHTGMAEKMTGQVVESARHWLEEHHDIANSNPLTCPLGKDPSGCVIL